MGERQSEGLEDVPGRAEVDTQKGQPWRDAARSGAGSEGQTQVFGAMFLPH